MLFLAKYLVGMILFPIFAVLIRKRNNLEARRSGGGAHLKQYSDYGYYI